MLVQIKTRVKNERLLIEQCANFQQTGIKTQNGETLGSMSLVKIVGEKLTPSQRSSLEIQSQGHHTIDQIVWRRGIEIIDNLP